jgi:hypothetical protein
LRFVLHDTLKKTGVPPAWIGGEATPAVDEAGRLTIEVRLIIECDEPRLFYYLAAFQGEFESRLLAIEPDAWDWVSRISWRLGTHREPGDADFAMPPADYWDHVIRDREATARKQGRLDWDRDALARTFEDTDPGDADFENTHPPQWDEREVHSGFGKQRS